MLDMQFEEMLMREADIHTHTNMKHAHHNTQLLYQGGAINASFCCFVGIVRVIRNNYH